MERTENHENGAPHVDACHRDSRREFLSGTASVAMLGGLGAGYGTFAWMAGRMLYPGDASTHGWQFVTDIASFVVGEARVFVSPIGAKVVVARQAQNGDVSDFAAFSSVCPHLGCQVSWEGHRSQFFCPCHNGTFDAAGEPTGGPPLAAHQSLPRYPLKIENGLLFIELPLESVGQATS